MPRPTVGVAFSGGRDSLALLHATARAARALGLDVVALHVHHGLVDAADAWVGCAAALCRRWRRRGLPVRLRWQPLLERPSRGDSVEAWARRARYAALASMARDEGASLVLLAHHRRDQAETVLLQALRGAGPRGLAAMPTAIERDGLTWARPWLDEGRDAIDAYVRRHRLRPIDDPSNADDRLARNRLRLRVWPALVAAFDDAETALAAVARRAQEADAVLAEVARADLAGVTTGDALAVARWLALPAARRANALRAWLAAQRGRGAPESLVQRLQRELPRARTGRWPLAADRSLALYRGSLAAVPAAAPTRGPSQPVDLSQPGTVGVAAWHGAFDIVAVDARGIDAHRLAHSQLRPRGGGERFACAPNGVPRSLKKQFQAHGVPEHARAGPLVWCDDELVFVPGLGIDARRWAAPGCPQVALRWRADVK